MTPASTELSAVAHPFVTHGLRSVLDPFRPAFRKIGTVWTLGRRERDELETADAAQPASNGRKSLLDWLRLQPAAADDDAYVKRWKRAWAGGAEARWAGLSSSGNPHGADSAFATAWNAGWAWADRQPDRRKPSVVRFAVPHRRATDGVSLLRRSARAGAVGLSVLAVAAWLWQTRRHRRKSNP